MSLSAAMKWVLLALVGLAIAIGVAIAAANLTSQQIGIASESVSAGDALAPSLHVPAEKGNPGRQGEPEAPSKEGTTTLPAEPPATTEEVPPSEEKVTPPHQGDDSGGGGGSDGDD